jgi:hypothetical protein
MPEIELRQIAVQMLFPTVLVRALHPTLENAEIRLNGIGVNFANHVFASGMANNPVVRVFIVLAAIMGAVVGHDVRFLGDVGVDDRRHGGRIREFDMEAPDFTLALDER